MVPRACVTWRCRKNALYRLGMLRECVAVCGQLQRGESVIPHQWPTTWNTLGLRCETHPFWSQLGTLVSVDYQEWANTADYCRLWCVIAPGKRCLSTKGFSKTPRIAFGQALLRSTPSGAPALDGLLIEQNGLPIDVKSQCRGPY